MRTFIQSVSKKVSSVVGGPDGGKLGDEILTTSKQQLDELEQQVTSVRSQFATYAEQMMQSCEASVLLSRSVADFYRSANNSARSDSVKLYEEVQDNAANNAVAIYQRQLQMDDGVISELDQWLQIVARVNEQIEEAERLRQAAETASARLQTLQNKVDSRRQGGSIFQSDGTDLQNRIEETERAQKNFEADFESARNEVRDNVQRIMQKRFTMFDRVYVQILECQVQFFERAAKDVDGFRRSIRNYRRKFPPNSGSSMIGQLSRTRSDGGDRSPPKARAVKQQNSAPVQPDGPVLPRGDTDFLGFETNPSSNPTPDVGIEASGADKQPSEDFEFSDFVTATSSSSAPPSVRAQPLAQQQQQQPQQPPADSLPVDHQQHPRVKRQVSDILGLSFGGMTGLHGHSDTEIDVTPRPAPPTNISKRGSRSSMDLGNAFDEDFWGTPSSKPQTRPTSTSMDVLDPMGDLMGSPSPLPTASTTTSTVDEKRSEPPHLMEENRQPAGRGAGVLNMSDAKTRREFVRQLQEDEKRNMETRENARDAVEMRVREWEYKGDVRRNLRSLLTSMDRVLWEGAKWKPVQMSELLTPDKIAKKYRKALNAVHTDKISVVRGYTPEQVALAEGVFMALNEAWTEYEKSQS